MAFLEKAVEVSPSETALACRLDSRWEVRGESELTDNALRLDLPELS